MGILLHIRRLNTNAMKALANLLAIQRTKKILKQRIQLHKFSTLNEF